jgi:hypothetical protein
MQTVVLVLLSDDFEMSQAYDNASDSARITRPVFATNREIDSVQLLASLEQVRRPD